jgi:hypothetical protein
LAKPKSRPEGDEQGIATDFSEQGVHRGCRGRLACWLVIGVGILGYLQTLAVRQPRANRRHGHATFIGRIERGFDLPFNHLFGARKQRRLLK